MKISIENLGSDTSELEIRRLFSSYGKVRSIKLALGPLHSKRPGSGIVEMEGDHATRIVAVLDRCLFKGAVLRVKEAETAEEAASPVEGAAENQTPKADADPNNRTHNTLNVVSVEMIADSATGQPNDWCRYTITSGASSITGLRRGSVDEVTQYAEESAEAFNLRNMLKCGRPPAWSSRTKK